MATNPLPLLDQPLQPARTAAEFFAGIGLMRLGLEKAGWKVVYANDIAADKKRMYDACFPDKDAHFVLGDIHDISATSVPRASLMTASFPCTDLSLAGMRDGLKGKQSSAFWGFVRILEGMGVERPQLVLLENVTGFLTSRGGKDFEAALHALNQLGYAVDAFIIDAARFVPQSRVRLFVVGSRRLTRPVAANETAGFYESELRPRALADFIYRHPDIDWNVRKLPSLPNRDTTLSDIIEPLAEDSSFWWSTDRATYLRSQMSAKHAEILEEMIGKQEWSYGTVFRRVRSGRSMAELRCDGVAGCLRTPKGGSGRQILVRAGFGTYRARLLTPRECARLMGADDFPLDVPLNQALFGFGDAVCVPVVEWIAKNYLSPVLIETCQDEKAAYG